MIPRGPFQPPPVWDSGILGWYKVISLRKKKRQLLQREAREAPGDKGLLVDTVDGLWEATSDQSKSPFLCGRVCFGQVSPAADKVHPRWKTPSVCRTRPCSCGCCLQSVNLRERIRCPTWMCHKTGGFYSSSCCSKHLKVNGEVVPKPSSTGKTHRQAPGVESEGGCEIKTEI